MRAGRLRHFVQLQRNTPTQRTKVNDPIENWQTFAECFAGIEPLTGREFLAAQQVQSDATFRITTRYLPDVTTRDRVRFSETPPGGVERVRLFDIKAVLDKDERHRELQLMCTEHHG